MTTNAATTSLTEVARSGAAAPQLSCACGPGQPPLIDLTLGELLSRAASAAPERIALIGASANPALRPQWTYAQMYAQSQGVAQALLQRFKPGERVAVWAPNIPEWVLLQYGAALAGLVLVTLNPGFKAAELEYVLKQSRPAGIFVVESFRGNAMRAAVDAVKGNCPELREVVDFSAWAAFIATGVGAAPAVVLPTVRPGDAVMIQYTSGTTGFPKGALLHHRGLVNNAALTTARMGVQDGGVYIGVMPLFHTGGCVVAVLGCASVCATYVLVEAFEPGLVLALTEQYRGSAMLAVPTMWLAMMEHPDFATRDLTSLRALCSGGSTVPAHVVTALERKLGAQFTIVFGQTECSPVALMTRADDSIADKANTLGTPLPHVEVKIVDTNTGRTAPVGEVGEICTRGYHVMLGYFEMPEATADAIDAEGWLHTGDLGAMDARGYFTIEGRLKDMIIRGGENIYPRELEELLFKHPAVGEVAVIGLAHEKWGEEVAAVIRPKTGGRLDKDELAAFMGSQLAKHKVPRHWFSVDTFPLTASGKIQKFKLREMCAKGDLMPLGVG